MITAIKSLSRDLMFDPASSSFTDQQCLLLHLLGARTNVTFLDWMKMAQNVRLATARSKYWKQLQTIEVETSWFEADSGHKMYELWAVPRQDIPISWPKTDFVDEGKYTFLHNRSVLVGRVIVSKNGLVQTLILFDDSPHGVIDGMVGMSVERPFDLSRYSDED